MAQAEYSASEVRKILQKLFPQRRLVLSQFTFFNQVGVTKPSGITFRRGRQCYTLHDVLPIACVLALKEEGIPLKNIECVPRLIQENVDRIFSLGPNSRIIGFGDVITLQLADDTSSNVAVQAFLSSESHSESSLFWSFDVGALAKTLVEVEASRADAEVRIAA
jgi:hypothetical protein